MAKTPSSGTSGSNRKGRLSKSAASKGSSARQKRDTLVSLRNHMDDIADRLNQADHLTQQSVLSLQNAFSVLEKRVSHESSVNKAALTKRVDQLTAHLTGLISQTRSGVAQDLRHAKENPSLERLQSAIAAADKRISKAEMTQAAALTKVNRHIANLARAIDARLTQEAAARDKAIGNVSKDFMALQNRTDTKLQEIEQSSAAAIVRIGEHVVSLSNDFKERTDNNTQAISAKMSTIAIKTQREFDDYRSQIERRMESLEESQRNLDGYMDRSLSGLTTRIDNLEYGLTSVAPPAAKPETATLAANTPAPAAIYDDPFSPIKEELPIAAAPQPTLMTPPSNFDDTLDLQPAQITPQLTLVPSPAPAPRSDMALHAPKPFTPTPPGAVSAPPEYIPEAFVPEAAQPQAPLIQDILPVPPDHNFIPPASPSSAPQLYVASDNLSISGHSPTASDMAVADLIGADDLPYEDPAYAENISPADMKRPGAFDLKRKTAANGPKISRRNMGVGAMAIMMATVGYFALRGYIGKETQTRIESAETSSPVTSQGGGMTAPVASVNSDITPSTAPAIGDYRDNQGITASGDAITATTLEAAAESGDPVAEFQLGLSRLESGQTKQAIDLIRASANKGQPAAQYRLAKLYEAGEGVDADAEMARQLTERAAASGNRIAMHDLALYYAEGRGGVELNIKTAANWFEKAAQRGVVDSQYNLGVLYESGQGLPKNLTEAFVWYSIAARQGDQFARKHIDVLKEQLSAADLKRANARVAKFNPIALDEAANGIFKNVSWAQPQSDKDSRAEVLEAQTLLGQLGYKVGKPDGAAGPQTRKAILSFQKDRGLRQTGTVDAALVVQLQRAATT